MTNKEAIAHGKEQLEVFGGEHAEFIKLAIKALEQESVLDKVRADIMDTGAYEQEVYGETEFLKGINYCLGVIDKYKAEKEDA